MTSMYIVVGILVWITIGIWVSGIWYCMGLDQRNPAGKVVVILGWPGIAITMIIHMLIISIRRPRL